MTYFCCYVDISKVVFIIQEKLFKLNDGIYCIIGRFCLHSDPSWTHGRRNWYWFPHPTFFFFAIFNVDGASREKSRLTDVDGVLGDDKGEVLITFIKMWGHQRI